jgi:eukaryotic-like serine/threonine-protein kinase
MKECQVCKHCYADDVATCPKDGMPTVHTIPGEPVLEGKYHLENRIGQGGMGVVYKARHAYLKTQLAIKVILPDLVGNDPQLVTRFRQEALAAAAIRHMNVVAVTDYGVIDGTLPFLVMEYVEGESLHDLLGREKKLSPERAFELMSAACAGVGAAHHQGIVHRDLKPLNIMICSDKPNMSQAVKILDFGLAKIKSGELLGSFIQAQTTGLMGSPYYMAPEQWADDEPTPQADIYSLGVMLYQILTGDVPFKGSSIPAIMKKHISDEAPTLADGGISASAELERAIFHTLQKDPKHRTQSVEEFVEELRFAVHPAPFIHTTSGRTLPVSSLKVTTKPPKSSIYVDNIAVGQSKDNGELLLEGVQSGNHHLRVSHDGFQDWLGDVICDGKPQQVVAELRHTTQHSMPGVTEADINVSAQKTIVDARSEMAKTMQQDWEPSRRMEIPVETAAKSKGLKPVLLGIGGLFALFFVSILGIGAAWMLGLFGGGPAPANNSTGPSPAPSAEVVFKADLAAVPGGTFRMGRSDGRENERPENPVTVQAFRMDKTEVTNAEYLAFVTATGHTPVPAHWVNDRPVPGTEQRPVRFVNIEDVNAFAAWRSTRDGVAYRLPTEAEWEYAARNGAKNTLYPWGNSFQPKCAVTDRANTEPETVGSTGCANDWGILDLIGNVYEWTSSKASLYPGSKGEVRPTAQPRHMIRGGAALTKSSGDAGVTSTFRADVDASTRDKELGFRLVTGAMVGS